MSLINSLVRNLLLVMPMSWRLPLEYYYLNATDGLEPELYYLNDLIDRSGCAIDVGANKGYYTYALAQLPKIRRVEAFEPQPWCSELISAYSKRSGKNINIHTCALSDTNSTLELNIPILRGRINTTLSVGLASFKKPDVEHECVKVPVCRLDDRQLKDIVFIKIDVEGHEESALNGARQTILSEKPVLLIEIENRHLYDNQTGIKDVQGIVRLVEELGYQTYFLADRQLLAVSQVEWIESENKHFLVATYKSRYIYNFIFIPDPASVDLRSIF
jgi:FkbM family methyltransferase